MTKINWIKLSKKLKKLKEYNNSLREGGLKEFACILTDTTVKKIFLLKFFIQANITMIIQRLYLHKKAFYQKPLQK